MLQPNLGLPQKNCSFENALRVGFRLSGAHIRTYETKSSYLYYTAKIDHFTFYKAVLKLAASAGVPLIRSPKIEKPKINS